jgi:hypothetical protein
MSNVFVDAVRQVAAVKSVQEATAARLGPNPDGRGARLLLNMAVVRAARWFAAVSLAVGLGLWLGRGLLPNLQPAVLANIVVGVVAAVAWAWCVWSARRLANQFGPDLAQAAQQDKLFAAYAGSLFGLLVSLTAAAFTLPLLRTVMKFEFEGYTLEIPIPLEQQESYWPDVFWFLVGASIVFAFIGGGLVLALGHRIFRESERLDQELSGAI